MKTVIINTDELQRDRWREGERDRSREIEEWDKEIVRARLSVCVCVGGVGLALFKLFHNQ